MKKKSERQNHLQHEGQIEKWTNIQMDKQIYKHRQTEIS